MHYYAIFFQLSTGYVEGSIPPRFDDAHRRPIEATGDRGLVRIDGRMRSADVGRYAAQECQRRGYVGWRIKKGRNLRDAVWACDYWPVEGKPSLPSASSASYGA